MGGARALGLFAVGALAVIGWRLRGHAGSRSPLPPAVAAIIARHSTPDDYEAFSAAVRDHVKAGKPLTRAAAAALASVYLDPEHIPMIRRDLEAIGWR